MLSVFDNAFVSIRRWADGREARTLLASLLVVALLLCHGAMGGLHQLAPQLVASASTSASGPASGAALGPASGPAMGAALAHAHAGPDEERPAGHGEGHPPPYLPPTGFYLAALLVVLLASVLGPALGGVPLPFAARSWAVRRPPPAAILPGRPPTASSLQVFRL